MDHTLDFDILLSLIRKQKSKNAVNEEIIDLPADFVEYIKSITVKQKSHNVLLI